jgi:glycosyl transferase family 11
MDGSTPRNDMHGTGRVRVDVRSSQMIGIQLRGRLGNQMFQYAAARTLSESLGCRLLLAANTPTRRHGLLSHVLHLDRRGRHGERRQNGLLHEAFECGPSFARGRLIELSLPWWRRNYCPNAFRPKAISIDGEDFEELDPGLLSQPAGTWLEGLFQSAAYFAHNEGRVREWFRLPPSSQAELQRIVEEWPRPPERMAAVHVRRGDYLDHRTGIGSADKGWALPLSYYHDALARLPEGDRLAIFSDDPGWASEQFKAWGPWVSRGHSAAVDMMAMAACRTVVMANSSFSWWAAWLNANRHKTILAPEFHLGFRVGRWVPGGIAVDGWQYLRVAA